MDQKTMFLVGGGAVVAYLLWQKSQGAPRMAGDPYTDVRVQSTIGSARNLSNGPYRGSGYGSNSGSVQSGSYDPFSVTSGTEMTAQRSDGGCTTCQAARAVLPDDFAPGAATRGDYPPPTAIESASYQAFKASLQPTAAGQAADLARIQAQQKAQSLALAERLRTGGWSSLFGTRSS